MKKHFYLTLALPVAALFASASAPAATQKHFEVANRIYQRLNGLRLPRMSPVLASIAEAVEKGDLLGAAKIASVQPGFINNTMFQYAAEISDVEGSRRGVTRIEESTARIMVVVNQDLAISRILTDQEFFPTVRDPACSTSGNPFSCLSGKTYRSTPDYSTKAILDYTGKRQLTISSVQRIPGTRVRYQYNENHPNMEDVAGVFSDRGFGTVGYVMGTNRRVIQQWVEQLWGLKLSDIRSGAVSDRFVRGDVSRNPEGTGSDLYINQCKTCHGIIDGLNSAFVFWDSGADTGSSLMYSLNNEVVSKYNRSISNYPDGFKPTSNEWNLMFTPEQRAAFGWKGDLKGKGVHSLAVAISKSRQFYRGMVRRAASYVCPSPNPEDPNAVVLKSDVIEAFAAKLEAEQNLRRIFEAITVRPECLGAV